MAPLANTYVQITADFSQFRNDVRNQARDAGRDAGRIWATQFRAHVEQMLRGFMPSISPRLDLTAFRSQFQLFRNVYLRDQSFNVTPNLQHAGVTQAFQQVARTSASAGRDSGDKFGKGFSGVFIHVLRTVVARALLASSALSSILPVLVELGTASVAFGAALPAVLTTVISLAATLKLAFSGVGNAFKEAFTGKDPEKLAEALSKLSPAARGFVLEVTKFKPLLAGFQDSIQQAFFEPLKGAFNNLIRSPALDILRTTFQQIAHDAGTAGALVAGVFAEAARSGQLARVFAPVAESIQEILRSVPRLLQAFLTLADVGGRFAQILFVNVGAALEDFVTLVENAAADGRLEQLFRDGLDILSTFGALLADVGSIASSVFGALTTEGGSVLGVLGAMADEFARFLKSAEGQQALASLALLLHAIGDVIRVVVKPLLPVIAQLVIAIVGPFAQALQSLVGPLGDVVERIARLLLPIIRALMPHIDQLITILADFLVAALTEVAKHMDVMAPVALRLVNELGPHMTPVLLAMGEALMAIVPLIPVITKAMIALLPAINALIPVVIFMTRVTTFLWQTIAVLIEWTVKVIAWLVQLAQTGYERSEFLRRAFENAWNFLRDRVFSPLANAITQTVPNAFRSGADAITAAWHRVREAAAAPVRFVIETVINKGIVGTFNTIANWLPGVPRVNEIRAGFSVGGLVAGMPSLVDDRVARGPGGRPVGLAGGEFIMPSDRTREWLPVLEWMRKGTRARSGSAEGYQFGGLFDAARDPAGWVRGRISGLIERIPGGGIARGVAVGLANKLVGELVEWAQDKLNFGGQGFVRAIGPGPGGPGWLWMINTLRLAFPGLALLSGYRPGSRTASGSLSYHAFGRAVDVPPVWSVFSWIRQHFRSATRELIFSPAGALQIKNGTDHVFTGPVVGQHFDHIHWALDRGGWLTPGWNLSYNGTGRPEPVTAPATMDTAVALLQAILTAIGGVGGDIGRELNATVFAMRQLGRARG